MPPLLLIGQQEALYDLVAAVKRAKQLIPMKLGRSSGCQTRETAWIHQEREDGL
jgi:hypothetical protein